MAQPEPRNPNNNNRPRNNGGGGPVPDPNFNWRGLILFSIAVALIAGAYLANTKAANTKELPFPNFMQKLEEKDAFIIDAKNPFDLVRDTQNMKEYLEGTL